MKKSVLNILIIIFIIFLIISLNYSVNASEAFNIEWEKILGGSDYEYGYSIQQTQDEGFILIGQKDYTCSGYMYDNCWILKFNKNGILEWQKTLGGCNDCFGKSIQQTEDGGYIVAGSSKTSYDYDYLVVKLSESGDVEWQKTLGGSGNDYANSIQQTNDGGYIVVGSSEAWYYGESSTGNHGKRDYWVIKLSASGVVEWQKSYGGSGNDEANSVQQTLDNGYIIVGSAESTGINSGDLGNIHGKKECWVIKLSENGTLQWEKPLGGSGEDSGASIKKTRDGGYIVAGRTDSNDGDVAEKNQYGGVDYWVIKLSSDGDIEWEHTYGRNDYSDHANDIIQSKDGGYVVVGTSGTYDTLQRCWTIKLSESGIIEWEKVTGTNNNDDANSLTEMQDGGYVMVGEHYDLSQSAYDLWLFKLNSNSTEVKTSAITITAPEISLNQYEEADISYTITPENASDKQVMWSSDSEDVARVVNGTVYANKPGTATITATTMDRFYQDHCTVTVSPITPIIPVSSLTIDKSMVYMEVNDVATINATIEPNNSSNRNVIWTNGGRSDIVSVDKYGNITAHKPGVAVIQAAVNDGDNYFWKECSVYVYDSIIHPSSIKLDKDEINLNQNESTELSLSILPLDTVNRDVIWSSSNENIATVVGGIIYTHNAGTAQITVTTSDGGLADSCTINVLNSTPNASAPNISTQPYDKTVNLGEVAALSISATATGTISYQWYSNTRDSVVGGAEIDGATYTTYNLPTSNVGITYYYCIVTNTDNNVSGIKTATSISDISAVTVSGTLTKGSITCDNAEVLALCESSKSADISIDFSDEQKRKEIFGLWNDDPIYYEIYYGKVDENSIYQGEKKLDFFTYNNTKRLVLNGDFTVNGKYIMKIYAGATKNSVLVTVNVTNKSDIKSFGHVNLPDGNKVAIIPCEIINRSKLTQDQVNTLNEISTCIKNYSVHDWSTHMEDYHKYNSMFPDGAFSNYLDARLKAQAKLALYTDLNDDKLINALRAASSEKLQEAYYELASAITCINTYEISESIKKNDPKPLLSKLCEIALSQDKVADIFTKGIPVIKIIYGVDSAFKTLGYISDSFTKNNVADNFQNLHDIFYKEYNFLLKDKFSDFPAVLPGEWLEITYHNEGWPTGIVITDSKVFSTSTIDSSTNNLNYVPCNIDVFNSQLKENDFSTDLIKDYPEKYIYEYITSKTILNIQCPIIIDVYYGSQVIANINNTEPMYLENEYGLFCSYYENGELEKKVILYNPNIKIVVKGTGTGTMDFSVLRIGSKGLFQLASSYENVPITSNTIITATDTNNLQKLNIDEDGDGTNDTQYTGTQYSVLTELELSDSNIAITKGNTYKLNYTLYPNSITNQSGTWWSNDISIANVDESGLITANNVGETDINLSVGYGLIKSCHVTVTKASSSSGESYSLTLNKSSLALTVGNTTQLIASVLSNNETNNNVIWSISSGNGVVSVNDGLVTALSEGTAVVKATSCEDSTKYSECVITVTSSGNDPQVPDTEPIEFNAGVSLTKTTDGFIAKIDRTQIPSSISGFTKISICQTEDISEHNIKELINNTETYLYGVGIYDEINGAGSGNSLKTGYNILMLLDNSNKVLGFYIIQKENDIPVDNGEKSTKPLINDVTVINNGGANDIIEMRNLKEGDHVLVYDSFDSQTAIIDLGVVNEGCNNLSTFSDLGDSDGKIYISITSVGMSESDRLEVDFSAPNGQSEKLDSNDLTNFWTVIPGFEGAVVVNNVNGGDIIKVYDQANGGNLLGMGTLPVMGNTGGEVVALETLPIDKVVYVSITRKGMFESERVSMTVTPPEPIVTVLNSEPYSVMSSNNFDQTFTISINGTGDFVDNLDKSYVTLNGDFSNLNVESITRNTETWKATIRLTGTLLRKTGSGTITVNSSGWMGFQENHPISATINVDSANIPVESIILKPVLSMQIGSSEQLEATIIPNEATNRDIKWSIISGSDKVTITNGVVKAIKIGTAVIRATSSENSNIFGDCTINIIDTKAPTAPANLNSTAKAETSITLKWDASTDNIQVKGYEIYRDGIKLTATTKLEYINTGLIPGKTYTYTVKAYDIVGNKSDDSNALNVTTVSDTQAPTAPTNLNSTAKAGTSITLKWDASTDNTQVKGYEIYRDGIKLTTTTKLEYINTGLIPGKTYTYTVKAYDIVGNKSDDSNTLSVTTV